jgi:thiol:disulfide interchange protein DsbD
MLKVKANFVLFVLFLGFISQGFAQVYEPVSWKFETTYTDDNKAELKFIATIEDGWHVYALNLPSDEGPIPTSFTLTPSDKYQVVGKVKQGKYKTDFDPNFDMDLNYFDKKATFT